MRTADSETHLRPMEAGVSAATALGPALVACIRKVVREEFEARAAVVAASPAPPAKLVSPEEASRTLHGRPSADTIRALIHRGVITLRLAGATRDPKRPSYLVTVDEVLAALVASGEPLPLAEPVNLDAARARARECAAGKRGGR